MRSAGTSRRERLALLALSLVVAAFLVVGLRAARAESEAREIAVQSTGRADDERALEAFRDARRLNPDTGPELAEAALLSLRRRYREAIAILERVVREEPQNADAWTLLLGASRAVDLALAVDADRELRRLKPPVAD